ncbi:hypothetical protein [Xenophilus sp. Marseille-Q4582]|uniref:hypothetical protein n=1 Tax=Xenophilus sp. Marseille-Q4582 TaxID=2866600 RepID=UPI001CE40743|nr:hypothetical protein [Xenophilus sp. Marseille-Q4582]
MSMEFLNRLIRNARFPLVVRHRDDVDQVRLLKAAELITASVPRSPLNSGFGDEAEAVVFGVTERGELVAREAKAPAEPPLRRGARLDDD